MAKDAKKAQKLEQRMSILTKGLSDRASALCKASDGVAQEVRLRTTTSPVSA
jgi:hypothetical protein